MHICMFTSLFPPIPSGSSSMTYRLACKLVNNGHRVTVFCARLDGSPLREKMDGVDVIRLPAVVLPRIGLMHNFKWFGLTFLPGNFLTIARFFKSNKVDIIHSHNHIFDLSLLAVLISRYARVPLVLTLHTIVQHSNPVYNFFLKILDGVLAKHLIVRQAAAVVSVDFQMKTYIRERFQVHDTVMIPYGMDLIETKAEDRSRIRTAYGLGKGPVILSLGHLHPLRDRKELFFAMPTILASYPEARLLIVGDVTINDHEKWMDDLGLAGKAIFTGAVPQENVHAFLSAADIEAHWLIGVAGISLAGMEAMSAGLPVLTVEFSSAEEANGLINWKNIITVPRNAPDAVADAVLCLLNNPHLQKEIGENGRSYIEKHFSWDSVCEKTECLYAEILSQYTNPSVESNLCPKTLQ